MKLKTQLFFSTFLVIILFVLTLAFTMADFNKLQRLQDLSLKATELQVSANEFKLYTNAVFLEKNDFAVLVKRWNRQALLLEEEIHSLLIMSNGISLPDSVLSSFSSLKEGVEAQSLYREPFKKSTHEIQKRGALSSQVQYNGLYGYFLTLNRDENSAWRQLLRDLVSNAEAVNAGSNTVSRNLMILTDRLNTYRQEMIRTTFLQVLIISAVIALFSAVYMALFSNRLSRGFTGLEQTMKQMAERNLAHRTLLKGSREMNALGSHINEVNSSFGTFINEVKEVSFQSLSLQDTLAAGTAETLAALQQINKNIEILEESLKGIEGDTGNSEQSVRSISLQIKELNTNLNRQSSLIQNNLNAVEKISSSITGLSLLTEKGRDKSSVMTERLEEGGSKVELSHSIILKVAKSIQDVMEITHIINEISDQTNILSMNAAIESAHAGEAGKGFAVVAEEIRNLAESTAENAHQIDETLKNVADRIDAAIESSTASFESMDYLNAGLAELSTTMETINQGMKTLNSEGEEIVRSSRSLKTVTANITESSQKISSHAVEITDVISGVRENTTFASGNIEEIALGSREIISTMKEVHSVSENNREGLHNLEAMISTFNTQPDEDTLEQIEELTEEPAVALPDFPDSADKPA
ncbi:MAG: methyl-accepting chemotaxis protein [Spirochaetales bacterium]|nr:methyl-accepting chemotaxis protein [Spirochaetales bacterium]